MITVACVLRTPPTIGHADKQKVYGPTDVLKLKKAIGRFLSVEHRFVCLTDRTDIPVDTIPLIGNTPSWWAKLELFRPGLFDTPVFYIDLDMVICNELDSIVNNCVGKSFVLMGDRETGVGSAVMYWEGDHSYLWLKYCENPSAVQEQYRRKPRVGDQAYIEDNTQFTTFTDNPNIKKDWFFKLKDAKQPHPDCKILYCQGQKNKLHKIENNEWVEKYWKNL